MVEGASSGEPLRFTITSSSPETDAPTVDDLLGQLRDIVDLLREIERAVAPDGKEEIEWRVVNARRNSPLSFEVAPFSKKFGTNIVNRDRLVRNITAKGLEALRVGGSRPEYFSDTALRTADSIFLRVTKGLSRTSIEFGKDIPSFAVDASNARFAKEAIKRIQMPDDRPYREIGSVEGFFQAVERDGFGRALVQIKSRLTGDVVKCFVRGHAEQEIERRQIRDLWKEDTRLVVYGLLHFKALGRVTHVDAENIKFTRDEEMLPSLEDIIDRDFTGGLSSEAYIEERRGGHDS